jgi:glycosyltransferase domain-containing protein
VEPKLTIVIITFNRYNFLLRALKFYKDFNLPLKILILDSSEHEPADNSVKEICDSIDVNWIRYEPSIFFCKKIADGSKYITTDYAVLAADDDFLFEDALLTCVNFLESNTDYSSCHGLYYQHYLLRCMGLSGVGLAPLYQNGTSSEQSSASDRVAAYLDGHTAYYPFYAVHNAGQFKFIWQQANKASYDWGLGELAPCIISLILGKMRVLNLPYATREPNDYAWFDKARHLEMYSKEKLRTVAHEISFTLSKYDEKIELDDANKFLMCCLERYVSRALSEVETSPTLIQKLKILIKIRVRLSSFRAILILGRSNFKSLHKSLLFSGASMQELNSSRLKYSSFTTGNK